MADAERAFSSPRAFRRYLDRLPVGFEFEPANSLSDCCPLASWARTFDGRAVVAGSHVAWDGSFAGPCVERLARWQESLSRRVVLHALATGGGLSVSAVVEMLECVTRPAGVRIGPPTRATVRPRA